MKVVTASTPEQQLYVKELINKLYETIFPAFFSEEYITKLKEFNLMDVPNLKELNLIEIMEVTAAIQTISTILEELSKSEEEMDGYAGAFHKNASILSKYQIDFPFQLVDFKTDVNTEEFANQNTLYM
ncbi:DUF5365 family protein [Aquibacillus salsiterrae]|uniref:YhcU family protein n=1 Tax=Aquibacillus salsiterrae TaxID=2950439 RepID=A0A9X4ADG7_9BACI|nr:DUF5365 family protein [Aquibacillus salsiterrae]MDC3415316.1 YhcU family protein [Aquibacillus salsiterrae]